MILKKFKEIKQIFFLQHQCHHFHENKTMFYMYQKKLLWFRQYKYHIPTK